MTMPKAILNGQLIEAGELTIPAIDSGFVWGTTLAEQMRTFDGAIFQLDNHLERFFRSLEAVGTEPKYTRGQLVEHATELVAANHALLDEGDDLALVLFATPGGQSAMGHSEPRCGLHTFPLPFAMWADKYERGESLVTSSVRQVGPDHWAPAIKCRSRMHYFLADQQVRAEHPQSRALLLDDKNFVCEATTANVLVVVSGDIVSPKRSKILPGISLAFVEELAAELEIDCFERDISREELATADELLLTSTPFCILPVTELDRKQVGDGTPGTLFRKLSHQWSQRVAVNYQSQAQTFRHRRIAPDDHV